MWYVCGDVPDLDVVEVWKEREETRQLSRGAAWVVQCDGSEGLREVSEIVFNAWYEAVDLQFLEFQSVNVR